MLAATFAVIALFAALFAFALAAGKFIAAGMQGAEMESLTMERIQAIADRAHRTLDAVSLWRAS